MPDSEPTPAPPIPFGNLCQLLGTWQRWVILKELAKGEPLPATVIARLINTSRDATSKQLAFMKKLGGIVQVHGRCYKLAPAIRPAPGTMTLDFGLCVLRLDRPLE